MLGNLNPFNRPIITKTINKLVGYGADCEASDIQLEIIADGSLEVKYKVFGQFADSLYLEPNIAQGVFNKLKHLAALDAKHTNGALTLQPDNRNLKLGASLIKTGRGEIINLKIKPLQRELFFLDELGLQQDQFKLIEANLYGKGLTIISGPAGSGKTTAAFSYLLACNSINFNIYSLAAEELLKLKGINQVVIKNQTARGWNEALAAVAKQDADIIYLAEPPVDMDAGVLAALSSSKIIIISLEAASNLEALKKLTVSNLYSTAAEARFNLLINQRLARRLCPRCAFSYNIDEQIFADLNLSFEILDQDLIGLELFHAQGCAQCGYTGYLGQLGLFEVAKPGQDLSRLLMIKNYSQTKDLLNQATELSLTEDGFIKALKGLTTIEELKRVI